MEQVFLYSFSFLSDGNAALELDNIIEQVGGNVVGIVIEMSLQTDAKRVRDAGDRVESLAEIATLANQQIIFEEDWIFFEKVIDRRLKVLYNIFCWFGDFAEYNWISGRGGIGRRASFRY